MTQRLQIPARFSIRERHYIGSIRQLLWRAYEGDFEVEPFSIGKANGHLARGADGRKILVVEKKVAPPLDVDAVIRVPSGVSGLAPGGGELRAKAAWLEGAVRNRAAIDADIAGVAAEAALSSWNGQFAFLKEVTRDGETITGGLREPQIGALHAAIAHWCVSDDLSTIVMPTGTGKTETMLALLVSERLGRLLVVVPTRALRDQIAEKFVNLGLLKEFGVIGKDAAYPVVGTMLSRPRTVSELRAYFCRCNVVVTTMNIVGGCDDAIQDSIADSCSHLFLDEAHHSSARSWDDFRRRFLPRPVLQFTATPFRGDGRHVDGKIIFAYPLRKAQEGGYFKRINFHPVSEFNARLADRAIAEAAVAQLELDRSKGLQHLVMARTNSIARGVEVLDIYRELAASHEPVLIHSKQSGPETRQALAQLRDGKTRIIVCVDMLGEGFDLPELKIAALHDMHKSLAITLQFTGRFTRVQRGLGEATMIANIADADVEDSLRELYAEDPDWNLLIRDLSEGASGLHSRRSEFMSGFAEIPPGLSLQNILPKMSSVVYRTSCDDWRPEGVEEAVDVEKIHSGPVVNRKDRVIIFVTRELEPIPWGNIKEIQNVVWDLYLVHWRPGDNLLFIHSSNNGSHHEKLAQAICGGDSQLIRGEKVFRVFHGIKRILLMNLGLNHSLSRAVRFTMHVGPDIHQALSESHYQNKVKSNVFGRGYEGGGKVTIGCSQKGRVWSYQIAGNIKDWVDWCGHVGKKLLDETISSKDFLEHVIVPEHLDERPRLVPLAIEWSEELLHRSETTFQVNVAGDIVPFFEAGLELVDPSSDGPLRFRVYTASKSSVYEVEFLSATVNYRLIGSIDVELVTSRRTTPLSQWFQSEPPVIRFEDGAFLIYNDLFRIPTTDRIPFDKERIEAWDWTGTDLSKEAQRPQKRPDSIQYRVINDLCSSNDPDYDIVFNDDETNEAADIIAMKVAGEDLLVHMFHCKYSKEPKPGSRVGDLYEVCGQAQKSVFWKGDVAHLVEHMKLRDARYLEREGVSRFEKGVSSTLASISKRSPFLSPCFKIFIVQPGFSKSAASLGQLDLLAVTELYLKETYGIDFGVIASD